MVKAYGPFQKYGASIHDIAAVNKLRNRHKIKVGNKLKIPMKGQLLELGGQKIMEGQLAIIKLHTK